MTDEPGLNSGHSARVVKDEELVPLNVFPLDDAALAALAEIDQQERELAQQMIGQRIGLIRLIARQQRLDGVWKFSDDKKSLVRIQ